MDATVARLCDLPTTILAPLLAESEREGWRFVRRLADEWANGSNRFGGPGELLLGASVNRTLVGVCGLNVDPYAGDPAVGRVRRLYVMAPFRGRGVGRLLMQEILQAASGRFRVVRVRTESQLASRFYEALGFLPAVGSLDCSHTLALVG